MSMYPPAGPPPGYGPPPGSQPNPYGGGYPQQEHPQGTTILVLGILGIVLCQILAPVAWIMGNSAIKEIDANPARYSNRGSVQAGRIMGMVVTILAILFILGFIALLVVGGASSTTSG